jgi:hypothetical protein
MRYEAIRLYQEKGESAVERKASGWKPKRENAVVYFARE